MKLNKIFSFKLESTKQVNLFKKLGNEISSSETTKVIYFSSRLNIKRNENIIILPISKQKNGVITYVCNYIYGVGEFIFYTHKEIEKIKESWLLIENREKPLFNQWRMLYFKDSVITEFIDPVEKANNDAIEAEQELNNAIINAERAKEKLKKTTKRFV